MDLKPHRLKGPRAIAVIARLLKKRWTTPAHSLCPGCDFTVHSETVIAEGRTWMPKSRKRFQTINPSLPCGLKS